MSRCIDDLNTVFQSYALFHLSVWDNIAFGLRLKKASAPEIQSRVSSPEAGQMEALRSRFPAHLSGGQQQQRWYWRERW